MRLSFAPFTVLVLLFAPLHALAADGFQGTTWAMTPDAARAALPEAKCRKAQDWEDTWRVSTCKLTFMEVPTDVRLKFVQDALHAIEVWPHPEDHAHAWAIYDALAAKYGQPEGSLVGVYHDLNSATVRGAWPSAYIDIQFQMYPSTSTKPLIRFTYTDPVLAEQQKAATAAKQAEAGKGL